MVKAMKFIQYWIAEGDTAGMAVLGLTDVCELVFEIDVFPFKVE